MEHYLSRWTCYSYFGGYFMSVPELWWRCLLDKEVVKFLAPAIIILVLKYAVTRNLLHCSYTEPRCMLKKTKKLPLNWSWQETSCLLICRWYEFTQNPARSQSEFTAVFTHRWTNVIVPCFIIYRVYTVLVFKCCLYAWVTCHSKVHVYKDYNL